MVGYALAKGTILAQGKSHKDIGTSSIWKHLDLVSSVRNICNMYPTIECYPTELSQGSPVLDSSSTGDKACYSKPRTHSGLPRKLEGYM